MLVIGLTGGIGSGKSTVANLFAKYGIPIIDADVVAREITAPNEPVLKKIISHFSDYVLLKDGVLDRSKLREIIFKLPQERKWLESVLHPAIRERIEQQIVLISVPYCIIVIPLLFETAPHSFINRILVIDAPEQTQIDRVITRDQSDKFQIEVILNTQASREQRLQGADDVIINDGSLEDLTLQVEKLHKFYSKLSAQ